MFQIKYIEIKFLVSIHTCLQFHNYCFALDCTYENRKQKKAVLDKKLQHVYRMTSNSFSYLSLIRPILLIITFAPILYAIMSTYILVYNKEMSLIRIASQKDNICFKRSICGIEKDNSFV